MIVVILLVKAIDEEIEEDSENKKENSKVCMINYEKKEVETMQGPGRKYVKTPEKVVISERDWDGSPIVVNHIQILPSGFPVIKSISDGKVITLFLDSPIPNEDIEFMKKNRGKIFIARDENGLYYDYLQNLDLQNNSDDSIVL
jgi:hypothetical protein